MSDDVRRQQLRLPDGAVVEYLEAGTGAPLVFLHGGGGAFAKAAFMPELARRYRVLAPSRPGYDGSSGTCATARDEAVASAAFIRQTSDGPVHLVAESAGGAGACWLAVLHPELIHTLVLVAPTAFVAHRERPATPPSSEEVELRLFGSHPAWSEPLTAEDVQQRQRNASNNAARMRSDNQNADLQARLSEITAPTLILWGTADRMVPPESGQIYKQLIPNSQRMYVYGAAHSLPVAACGPFVRLTSEFIERGEAFPVSPGRAPQT